MCRCVEKIVPFIIFLLVFSGTGASALETVQVLLLPFDIHVMEGKEYLEEKLPEVLRSFLEQEGAAVPDYRIPKESSWTEITRNAGGIRKFGMERGADYVIWGSLTRVGQKISIDAKMISTVGNEPPSVFFTQGQGIENLAVTVKELVGKFSLKLFQRERVTEIRITGNERIEADAIRRIIKTRPGDVFLAKSLSEDMKNVYKMGYFDDIRIESEESPGGKIIIFQVKEKPTLRNIRFSGNRIFDDDEVRENLTLKTGSLVNIYMIRSNLQRIEALYKDKNYHNVKISYEIRDKGNNQADLEYMIDEGGKVRIKTIRFAGNNAFGDEELKTLMKTSEKGFWSWLTSSGDLNREDLNQDIMRLTAYYHNKGFIEARVSDPEVEYKEEWIFINIKINEGARFKVGDVRINGDLILTEKVLRDKIRIDQEEYYNREVIRNDVLLLTDLYSDEGYAYADIVPKIDRKTEDLRVDLSYNIQKGKQVYFEKIIISGNTKTRDKVIRRQLPVTEQGRYSGRDLKRGVRNLNRLDYFEDIKVNTVRGSADDQMILKIDVREKPTGTFSFGGGYSSTDNLFAMASVTQRNLFGLGQILQLKAELGGSTTRFTTSFTEPWLFDIPLSAGFDLYKWERDYDTYDKDSTGGAVRFGYTIFDYTRFYLSYGYDIGNIEDITEDASRDVREMEGEFVTSSVTATLKYDSRDKAFNPTEGGEHSISVEYAGIGGDIGFIKYIAEVGQYFPLFWGTVAYLHTRGGYVRKNSGMKLPDYEKFYLGGINSVRGFDWRDISLFDDEGARVGGYQFIQFNAEYIIPLIKDAGVMGVIFYDTGNVYDKSESIELGDLRQSAGGGFRWYSPMGPIRIEYGYILDRKDDEDSGRWEFAMGSSF